MKAAIAIAASLAATPAFAHPGHFAEVSGHAHWSALAALSLAAVVGIVAWRKERRAGAARKRAERKA